MAFMTGISQDLIKRLFQYGMSSFFRIGKNINDVIEAIGISIDSVIDFLNNLFYESIPENMTESSIQEWFRAYSINYDASIGFDVNKSTIIAIDSAKGGQSVDYVNSFISIQFPAVFLTETAPCEILVEGSVLNFNDYLRLQGQIQKIMPIINEISYDIYITNEEDVAITGKAITGKALTGKITP